MSDGSKSVESRYEEKQTKAVGEIQLSLGAHEKRDWNDLLYSYLEPVQVP